MATFDEIIRRQRRRVDEHESKRSYYAGRGEAWEAMSEAHKAAHERNILRHLLDRQRDMSSVGGGLATGAYFVGGQS